MGKWSVTGTKAVVVTAGLGPLEVQAGGAAIRKGRLLYFNASSSDTPVDQSITIQIQRCTATGTGTTISPAAAFMYDPGDTVTTAVVTQTLTVTPTITASSLLYKRTFNQKYGMDYYAPPDAEIWYPATNLAGIVWDTPTLNAATASNTNVSATIDEN